MATPTGVPSITLGGTSNLTASGTGISLPGGLTIEASNPLGYFTLSGGQSITSGHFYVFYKNGTQYQVTAGKVCEVVAILMCSNVTAAAQLCSSQTVMSTDAASITSGTYMAGASGIYPLQLQTAGSAMLFQIFYQFPASSYPCFQGQNASNLLFMHLLCREK